MPPQDQDVRRLSRAVAWFCMEYGLDERLPIYAGGLGILAGDLLKAAHDRDAHVVGVGIFWSEGYTRQQLDDRGRPQDCWCPTPRGALRLDDGAVEAVVKRRTSLLPAGLTAVEGHFSAGDPVDLVDPEGRAVARGLVNFDAEELPRLLGRSTRELAAELGPAYEREVVHRDDLVLL